MAITKIHPIRRTLSKAVDYITDKDKTDGEIYVSTYGCTRETIEDDFDYTRSRASYHGSILAQHIIQSFAAGEVTPDQAHRIGIELAGRFTDHKHEYIIATHIDKGHIHNHIIMNHVDFRDHTHFRGNIGAVYKLRRISDEICRANGLSLITDPKGKGKSFYEWQMAKKGMSYKARLRNDIDTVIPLVDSYSGFLEKMRELGYEIKHGKYDSFRKKTPCQIPLTSPKQDGFIKDMSNQKPQSETPVQERFIRSKTLGEDYTREAIEQRIKLAREYSGAPQVVHPTYYRIWKYDQKLGLIENTHSYLVFITNNYQRQKTAINDAKKIAATYNLLSEKDIDSIYKLNEVLSGIKSEEKEVHDNIRETDRELDTINETIKYLDRFHANEAVWKEYVKSGRSSPFYETHRADLMIYESAVTFLKRNKVSGDTDPKTLYDRITSLEQQRDNLSSTLDQLRKDRRDLEQAKQNVEIIMNNGNITDRDKRSKRERD